MGATAKERTTSPSSDLRQLLSLSLALEETCSARTAQQIKEGSSVREQPAPKGHTHAKLLGTWAEGQWEAAEEPHWENPDQTKMKTLWPLCTILPSLPFGKWESTFNYQTANNGNPGNVLSINDVSIEPWFPRSCGGQCVSTVGQAIFCIYFSP